MPLLKFIGHFLSLFLLAPFIVNPGGRASLVEDGYATGSFTDAFLIAAFVIGTLYAMYYAIPIVQSAQDHGGEFIAASLFISASCVGFLWLLIKGQWIALDSSEQWAWAGMFVASGNAAYAVSKSGANGLVGLNFLKWFVILIGPGSLIYNPSDWSLVNNARASGGGGDYLVGGMLILAFLMVVYCGVRVVEACKNGGKVFLYQCVSLFVIFFAMLFTAMSNGLVAIENAAGWMWCGMVLGAIIGALAIAKSEGEES